MVDAGFYDLAINVVSAEYWIEDLDWKYSEEWSKIEMKDFVIDGRIVGEIKSSFDLTLARVNDAGHWVVEDKPDVALSLILDLVYGEDGVAVF